MFRDRLVFQVLCRKAYSRFCKDPNIRLTQPQVYKGSRFHDARSTHAGSSIPGLASHPAVISGAESEAFSLPSNSSYGERCKNCNIQSALSAHLGLEMFATLAA